MNTPDNSTPHNGTPHDRDDHKPAGDPRLEREWQAQERAWSRSGAACRSIPPTRAWASTA